MGAFLDKPKTEKTSSRGEGYGGLRYAVSAMQGWRTEMEDAHVCATEFSLQNSGFFGVFDGHAGSGVSVYCAEHMLETVLDSVESNEATQDDLKAKIEIIMKESFLKLDERLKDNFLKVDDHSGTTAVVALITPTLIVIANCGDSRAILCSDGILDFCTTDHKPYNVEEKARIEKAGGTVMMQRVNGSLAVSRALGDFDYKRNSNIPPIEQLVSPEPDVTIMPRNNDKEEFLLLACDGIYDVMSNDEIISYIRHKLSLTSDLEKICNDLIDLCLNKNSRDNMSVVLITFPNAPKVSSEAIEQEEKDLEKKQDELFSRLEKMVEIAHDPLDVEENHIMQQLTSDQSSDNFIVYEMRKALSEKLQELTKKKFGAVESVEQDLILTGPSDAEHAPNEFQNLPTEFQIPMNDGNVLTITGVKSEVMDIVDSNLLAINTNQEMEEQEETEEQMETNNTDEVDEHSSTSTT